MFRSFGAWLSLLLLQELCHRPLYSFGEDYSPPFWSHSQQHGLSPPWKLVCATILLWRAHTEPGKTSSKWQFLWSQDWPKRDFRQNMHKKKIQNKTPTHFDKYSQALMQLLLNFMLYFLCRVHLRNFEYFFFQETETRLQIGKAVLN